MTFYCPACLKDVREEDKIFDTICFKRNPYNSSGILKVSRTFTAAQSRQVV